MDNDLWKLITIVSLLIGNFISIYLCVSSFDGSIYSICWLISIFAVFFVMGYILA